MGIALRELQHCNTATAEQSRACSLDEVNAATHDRKKNVAKIWLFEILLLILPRNYEEKKEL